MQIKITPELTDRIMPDLAALYDNARDYMEGWQLPSIRENYEYYHGMLPVVQHESLAKETDRSCYNSVNGCMQDMQNILLRGGDAVEFMPMGQQDAYAAKAATKLVNQILMRENNGDALLSGAIKEALITRVAFIKRWWDTETVTNTERAEDLQDEQAVQDYLMGLKMGGLDINDSDIEYDTNPDGSFNIELTYTAKIERVKVMHVPIEECVIDIQAYSLQDSNYFCHRVKKNKIQAKELGVSDEVLESINYDDEFASHWVIGYVRNHGRMDQKQDNGQETDDLSFNIWLREHYWRTSKISKDGSMHLYKILEACNNILSIDLVDEIPFDVFTPLPISSNNIFGESIVDITKDIQSKKTEWNRYFTENMKKTALGRYTAIAGAYDRRSLLANVSGGVVEMDRPDAVNILPTPPLPSGLEFMFSNADSDLEMRTGVSRTSMGVNADMMKGDHGFDAINALQTAAQGRMKMIAHNIAYGGLSSLMRSIYKLYKQNAKISIPVLTAQGYVNIDPKTLPDRKNLKVRIALTAADKNDKVARLDKFLELSAKIEATQSDFITAPQKHFLYAEALSILGYENHNDFVIPIEQYQPQPDVMGQLQMEALQTQTGYVAAQRDKLINDAHLDTERLGFEQQVAADKTQHSDSELTFKQQHAADQMNLEHLKLNLNDGVERGKAIHNNTSQSIKEYDAETKRIKAINSAKPVAVETAQ